MNNFEILIQYLIPEWVRNKYPNYVNFVKYIFQSLEQQEDGVLAVLNNFYKFIDVSQIDDRTLEQYLYQYVNSFPVDLASKINLSTFIKNAKTFYASKGVPIAYRFLFNVLQGTLELHYMYEDIFRLSESNSTLSGTPNTNPDPIIHKIHDNYLYAYYTYQITTDLDFAYYYDIVKSTIHPAGMKLFWKRLIWLNNGVFQVPQIVFKGEWGRNFENLILDTNTGILDDIHYLTSSKENGLIASGKLVDFYKMTNYSVERDMAIYESKRERTNVEQLYLISGELDYVYYKLDQAENTIYLSGLNYNQVKNKNLPKTIVYPFIDGVRFKDKTLLNTIDYYLIQDLSYEKIGNINDDNYSSFYYQSSAESQVNQIS